ncbi:amidase signature enzyme [Mycena polygramma]|nr:amidase signature enzyme [Mycena polygramma]
MKALAPTVLPYAHPTEKRTSVLTQEQVQTGRQSEPKDLGRQIPALSFIWRRPWFSLALIILCLNLGLTSLSLGRDLQAGLDAWHFFSAHLVKGPGLRAVLELNPSALKKVALLDRERRLTGKRSELHGISVLLKDNIATIASEGMNTTAGSFSLLGSIVPDDAGVVKRLRKDGAIILGKANLAEFSGARGNLAPGWSGRGGQVSGAYFPHASPCGSSAGSAVAASIGLAAVTLGTETAGSITCPASLRDVGGIKPTVGWTSRAGGHRRPITRSLTDGAIVLSIIAGVDPNDNATLAQPVVPDFTQALQRDAFRGKRIGVPRRVFMNDRGNEPSIGVAFEEALRTIEGLGATIVDPADLPSADEFLDRTHAVRVLLTDFKVQLNAYFGALLENPSGVRSIADPIKFNEDNPTLEMPANYTDQSDLIQAEAITGFDAAYFASLAALHDAGRTRGINYVLEKYNLDALVLPAPGQLREPPVPLGFFPDDVTIGHVGPETVYPAPGMPFGISFFGTAWSDYDLIGFGYAYEQATKTRVARRAFGAAVPRTSGW